LNPITQNLTVCSFWHKLCSRNAAKEVSIEFRTEDKFSIEVLPVGSVEVLAAGSLLNRRDNRLLRRERLGTNRSSAGEQFRTTQN
jgi:hypothetical protein